MQDLIALWLPILGSSVLVFIASAIFWTVSPHHIADIQTIEQEEGFRKAIRDLGIKPGNYMFPNCDRKDAKSESYKTRFKEGPWGSLRLIESQPNMGKMLGGTFVTFLLISIFVGYLANLRFDAHPNPEYLEVFRFCGAAAVLGHVFGGWPHAFFFSKPTRFMVTDAIDSVIYGLLTAGMFAAFWPTIEAATPALPG